MRLFICALSLLLLSQNFTDAKLPYIGDRTSENVPACTENNVCVVFTKEKNCYVAWEAMLPYAKCGEIPFSDVYAHLEIELTRKDYWKIIVTPYNSIHTVEFVFERATLKFLDAARAQLIWNTTETNGSALFSMNELENKRETGWGTKNLKRYSFDISVEGEKLIRLLGGSNITWKSSEAGEEITMRDEEFLDLLDKHNGCDLSELKQVCYDTCDDITTRVHESTLANCSSHLWFHSPSEAGLYRQWHDVNSIRCHMGGWVANSTENNGTHITTRDKQIDSSHEVQCSAMEPAKMTSAMKILLGFGIGGTLLLILIVIGICCIVRRRRNKINQSETKIGTTRSASEYVFMKTPEKGASDRNGESPENEGLEKDKNKPTKRSYADLKTMKWNENNGVNGSMPTPAIQRPPPPPSPFKA